MLMYRFKYPVLPHFPPPCLVRVYGSFVCKVEPRLCEHAPQFVQYWLKMVPSAPWERLRQAREAFLGPETPQAGFWAGLPRESFTPNEAFLHMSFCVFFGTPQETYFFKFWSLEPSKIGVF